MNILEFLKKGSGIHIKKENRGKFTDYCGGKVTSECIAKGKASSNPTIRKRATFAANARKWKHKTGGKAFYGGVNVLDSNPKMYKKRMVKALDGTKLGGYIQLGASIFDGIKSSIDLANYLNALKDWQLKYVKAAGNTVSSSDVYDEANKLYFTDDLLNHSSIVANYLANLEANRRNLAEKTKALEESNIRMYDLLQLYLNNLLSNIFGLIGLLASNVLSSGILDKKKKTINNSTYTYSNGTGSLTLPSMI